MAATSSASTSSEGQNNCAQSAEDRLKVLYPAVKEEETPLPRSWSPKDKYNFIGLSNNNLRVHYKGSFVTFNYLVLITLLVGLL